MNDITALALLVSKAKASAFTMEYISQFEASDIDSDDVDLRFEVDGGETGTNVSIVDECGQAAQMIRALVEALEKAQSKATQQGNIACELFDEVTQLRRSADDKAPELRAQLIEADSELEALRQRIAELEKASSEPVAFIEHSNLEALSRGVGAVYVKNKPELARPVALYAASPALESRTVTVKLPLAVSVGGQGYREQVVDILAAAGIQVIEGEGQ